MKYKFNTNNLWTMLCFRLFFFQQPRLSIFSIWTSVCLLIDLVAMRRKFFNIIQCKDIVDSPFHYNSGCTFKWFLKHNNELVCVQTIMPIFPAKIFPKTWYNASLVVYMLCIYRKIVKRFTFSRVLKCCCRCKSDW